MTAGRAGYTRRVPTTKDADRTLNSLEQARRVAELAQEKLARGVVILDMRPVCSYTDYFVIATGQNPRQTKAIYDEVRERLKRDQRAIPHAVEGDREATWIVADYIDVVLHVFTPEARKYYDLEDLWGDVPAIELEAAAS
ncbi:MAG: ribosome silencing factor [Thermoleophilia bacterium]|nr:ribosome silencing factor [Thermoleophilia bacterium]